MAPGRVAIVTDSTACLPDHHRQPITVVPVKVIIGDEVLAEDHPGTAEAVAEALRRRVSVHTSRPTPAEFAHVYRRAAAAGAQSVVSVHLSSRLSGTWEAAALAACQAPVPVAVVDSGSVGMGLGYAVLAAAEAQAAPCSVIFCPDTLEYLHHGGRIGVAAAWVGGLLAIKPLLHLVDGHIAPLEKVRTATAALSRLADIAVARAGHAEVDLAVHHLACPARAQELACRLQARLPQAGRLEVAEVGAALDAHLGPGLLGVVIAPRLP